jgi:hypothetical protein
LANGTGSFNLLQGAMQSAVGLGAFGSHLLFGYIAHAVSFNAAFVGLAAASLAGGALYVWKMPETRRQ